MFYLLSCFYCFILCREIYYYCICILSFDLLLYVYTYIKKKGYYMARKILVMPSTSARLKTLGEQIKYARLRRRLSVTVIAERASVSRASVYAVEKGNPSVAIGVYAGIMLALGMPDEITLPCKNDIMGRDLEDLNLHIRRRRKQ